MSKAKSKGGTSLVPAGRIENGILQIRGQAVMLDQELAELYGVSTKSLVQGVKRNLERFPNDFMFQLSAAEFKNLRSQFVPSSWGGRRYPPYAFTEQGVAMLASVLRSQRAVAVSIEIVRVFVRLRRLLASHEELARKLATLESRMTEHDERFAVVFDAIREIIAGERSRSRKAPIGYHSEAARGGRGRRAR